MSNEATARVLEAPRAPLRVVSAHGGGPPRGVPHQPPVSNGRLGVLVLLAAETMLFVGLLGAYILFRVVAVAWPPLGLPRLPLLATWFNTVLLTCSAYTMRQAQRAARAGGAPSLMRDLVVTAVIGVAFLAVQGAEWIRLVRHGLTLSSGTYGASFYTLIGLHGVHVLAAVAWLVAVCVLATGASTAARRSAIVDACAIYWYFVVGLWALLFAVVYVW